MAKMTAPGGWRVEPIRVERGDQMLDLYRPWDGSAGVLPTGGMVVRPPRRAVRAHADQSSKDV